MSAPFSENQVHQYLYEQGLDRLIDDAPELEKQRAAVADSINTGASSLDQEACEETDFQLWRILKAKSLEKLQRLHNSVRYGQFVGSKIKLPIDRSQPMELDLIGEDGNGLFILELKVGRSAERHAFSELMAYSHYLAEMFALSGPKDITNVLVANLDAKITRKAFLYDLIVNDRNIIVYHPVFTGDSLNSLRLKAHIPSDDDFRFFTNQLLSHDSMACVVASFHDLEGAFESEEIEGRLRESTIKNLERLSGYAAQLMEAEKLHGFSFVRKPWQEIPLFYRNSLIICALNPFISPDFERSAPFLEQLDDRFQAYYVDNVKSSFDSRLLSIARRAIDDGLTHGHHCDLETPLWGAMVVSPLEVVHTHNFGFRPTGVLREAYVSYINALYARNEADEIIEDVSLLKINEIANWLRAWGFMESCGIVKNSDAEVDIEGEDDLDMEASDSSVCKLCHGTGGDVTASCSKCGGSGCFPDEDRGFAQCHSCYGDGEITYDICPDCGGIGIA